MEKMEEHTKELFPTNWKIMDDYIKYLNLQKCKLKTIESKLWTISSLFTFLKNKKAEELTRADLENFVIHLQKKNLKITTQNLYIINLKTFIEYLMKNNIQFTKKNKKVDFFQNIVVDKVERDTSDKKYITREDVIKMLKLCKSQRDRAFLFLLWDTGCRVGEIVTLNVNNVNLKENYITVNGKTGKRDIPISSSVPDLTDWLNQYEGTGDAPLFNTIITGRLTVRGAQNLVDRLVEKSGVAQEGKLVSIHAFRHGRMTELANNRVPEAHLRKFAGWEPTSPMTARYVHPKLKDIRKTVYEADGVKAVEATPEPEISINPIKCSHCQHINPFDSKYCSRCRIILNDRLAMEMKEAEQEAERQKKEELKAELMAEMKLLLKSDEMIIQRHEKSKRIMERSEGDN